MTYVTSRFSLSYDLFTLSAVSTDNCYRRYSRNMPQILTSTTVFSLMRRGLMKDTLGKVSFIDREYQSFYGVILPMYNLQLFKIMFICWFFISLKVWVWAFKCYS